MKTRVSIRALLALWASAVLQSSSTLAVPLPTYYVTEIGNTVVTDIPGATVIQKGADKPWWIQLPPNQEWIGSVVAYSLIELNPPPPIPGQTAIEVNAIHADGGPGWVMGSLAWVSQNWLPHDPGITAEATISIRDHRSGEFLALVVLRDTPDPVPDPTSTLLLLGCSSVLILGMKRLPL